MKAAFSCIDSVARFIVAHVTYRAPDVPNDNNCHGAVIPEVSLPFGKSSLRQPPGFAGFDQPPLQDFFEGGEIFSRGECRKSCQRVWGGCFKG